MTLTESSKFGRTAGRSLGAPHAKSPMNLTRAMRTVRARVGCPSISPRPAGSVVVVDRSNWPAPLVRPPVHRRPPVALEGALRCYRTGAAQCDWFSEPATECGQVANVTLFHVNVTRNVGSGYRSNVNSP
jgi:hypothetical protein